MTTQISKRNNTRTENRISCSTETRTILKSLKRGDESYDELLRRMIVSGFPNPLETMTIEQQLWVKNEEQ